MSNVFEPPVANQPQPQGGGAGLKIALVITAVLLMIALVCGGILVALLLPAVGAARGAAQRMQCSNNMKQISLALLNYESTYQSFPPAYTVDSNGNKLHSWRTLILPYMEQSALYEEIDLSKPWDDPANAFLADLEVPAFACPSSNLPAGMTAYVAIVAPNAIFSGPVPTQLRNVTDGISNTLLVVEVDPSIAVPWASPNDTNLQSYMVSLGSNPQHTGGSNAAMADGTVIFMSETTPSENVQPMVTKDGGETVSPGQY